MKIKKFKAASMQEAAIQIKKELGKDAMSTRVIVGL